MFDLVTEVAMSRGPSWRDDRTHWRDTEGYDLAAGPRSGGRLFPRTDERPDKPRKIGQISKTDCAEIVFGETDYEHDDERAIEPNQTAFSSAPTNDLSEVYGNSCYLAVYAGGKIKKKAYGRYEAHNDTDEPEWYELIPKYSGLRKLIATESGSSFEHRREHKRYSRRGHKKPFTIKNTSYCDIYVSA